MDEMSKNITKVLICGETIPLVSDRNEDYLHNLARYVDRKLTEIQSVHSNAAINEHTRRLFIALNIADDCCKTDEKLRQLQSEHEKYVLEMGRMQEENRWLHEVIRNLHAQLNGTPMQAMPAKPTGRPANRPASSVSAPVKPAQPAATNPVQANRPANPSVASSGAKPAPQNLRPDKNRADNRNRQMHPKPTEEGRLQGIS